MREISPAVGISAGDFLRSAPDEVKQIVAEIRREKRAGLRKYPSAELLDCSRVLTTTQRKFLLDKVAALVDENLCGRSEMCQQFAELLHLALSYLRLPSRPVVGLAIYFATNGREIHRWRHAWVRVGEEAIYGNVDCLSENPTVPKTVKVAPYWGPVARMPRDRRLREERGAALPSDEDVSSIWWPELKDWLSREFSAREEPAERGTNCERQIR